jgi:hypothetical protein
MDIVVAIDAMLLELTSKKDDTKSLLDLPHFAANENLQHPGLDHLKHPGMVKNPKVYFF